MPQGEQESDPEYRSRVAGELRRQGKVVEAHEAASGRRWDDPRQGDAGPVAGITGAIAQAMQGVEYSLRNPERQVDDDIAAGMVMTSGEDRSAAALGTLFNMLGPSGAMDVVDTMATRPSLLEDQR